MNTINNNKIINITKNSHRHLNHLTHNCLSPPRALQPKNRSCHNLCKEKIQPPPGAKDVLGLGLNYCIETPLPSQGQRQDATKNRLLRDIRLGSFFGNFNKEETDHQDDTEPTDYDPKLYIPNSKWTPKPTNFALEAKYEKFCSTLDKKCTTLSSNKRYNLTSYERHTLKELKT